MEAGPGLQKDQSPIRRGALSLFVLFLLPLIGLALLDIAQGEADLTLEWAVVGVGLAAIGVTQVLLVLSLWRGAR